MSRKKHSNREIVVHVAAELFLTTGYQMTSMDDIVAASKVSKTNIYYHFKSKEDVLLTIIDRMVEYYSERTSSIVSQHHVSVVARIEFMLRMLCFDPFQRNCQAGCPFLTVFAQTARESEAVREKVRRFFMDQLIVIEQLLDEGIRIKQLNECLPVKQTAALIVAMWEGGQFLAQVDENELLLPHLFTSLEWMLTANMTAHHSV
ncbi:TetR/AcrR family transcriptional regulator [Paenibacillus sp. 481]|uniref:TetR/AcrR family transcriptional regulator n=1 Tax=Paenibacillus sp. 481 TaxID=2835869 RepID=UPI001E5BE39B|nr:TetR/AcrR family transcriptional regulator [Paenibacillus sp. 481]UHA75086.1 TetR/AcrR family transcriptional regulator [Paenibacillus sp. 481]